MILVIKRKCLEIWFKLRQRIRKQPMHTPEIRTPIWSWSWSLSLSLSLSLSTLSLSIVISFLIRNPDFLSLKLAVRKGRQSLIGGDGSTSYRWWNLSKWGQCECSLESRKVQQMQPMRLCFFSCKLFESTFQNAQWRKVKQMQPMWLCILSGRQFEDTFENT